MDASQPTSTNEPAVPTAEPVIPPPVTLELGDYASLGEDFINVANALKSGDKQRAHALLKKLSRSIDQAEADDKSDEQLEKDKTDRAYKAQADSAATAKKYRDEIFSRPLPTVPQIPEPVNYDQFFAKR